MADGLGIRFGGINRYKSDRRGMRMMQSSGGMQAVLLATAEDIAMVLNSTQDGHYDVGPYGEGVYSTHHASPIGAHAFVRTGDQAARLEQHWYDTLNQAIGGI